MNAHRRSTSFSSRGNESRPDGGLDRQPVRAVFPVRRQRQAIESRSIQQVALVELSFVPGADMGQAMGQVVAMANRAMSRMPPGTLPPMIMRMDAGSVPVGYLVMSSKITSLGMMGDLAQNMLRPLVQENVPGTVTVSPFGPNMRSILVNLNPVKLKAYNLSPQDVVDALMTGNVVIPAGNLYIKDSMPMVPNNALVTDIQDIGKIPLTDRQERLHPRRGHHRRRHRRDLWIRPRQRQEIGLPADHQEGHGLDIDRGGGHPQVDGVVSRFGPQGRDDRLRVRRVARRGRGDPQRGHRGADRRRR